MNMWEREGIQIKFCKDNRKSLSVLLQEN